MLWGSQSCSSWAHRRRRRPCRRPPSATSPSPPWPPAPAGRRGPSRWLRTWLPLNWNLRKNRAMHLPLTTQGTEGSCSTGSPPPPSPRPPPSPPHSLSALPYALTLGLVFVVRTKADDQHAFPNLLIYRMTLREGLKEVGLLVLGTFGTWYFW